MKIRLIAGEFGGRTLDTPPGKRTKPMGERIRGALFNIIGDEIKDAHVLDAFAGTGSLGLEALSRGATEAVFIEKDRLAHKILQQNIHDLGVQSRVKVIQARVAAWIENNQQQRFDIIFADPPYHDTQFSTVKHLFSLLKSNGLMVLSYPGRGEAPPGTNGVVVVDNRSYSNAALTFYRRKDN